MSSEIELGEGLHTDRLSAHQRAAQHGVNQDGMDSGDTHKALSRTLDSSMKKMSQVSLGSAEPPRKEHSSDDDEVEIDSGPGVVLFDAYSSSRAWLPSFPLIMRSLLAWRPLLGIRLVFLPRAASFLRISEILLVLALSIWVLLIVVHVGKEKLTFEGCFEHKHKSDCKFLGYRLKKFGQHLGGVTQSLLACLFLPVARNSVLVRITGLSFDKLVKWHRWLGRAFIFFAFAHGIGFIVSWLSAGVLLKKMAKLEKLVGVLVILPLMLVFISSLDWARRRNYRLFWLAHATMWPAIIGLVLLHYEVEGFVARAALPVSLFIVDKLVRAHQAFGESGAVPIHSVKMIGADIVKLQLEPKGAARRHFAKVGWLECSWVYLSIPALGRTEAHPFSICNSNLEHDSERDRLNEYEGGKMAIYVKAHHDLRTNGSTQSSRMRPTGWSKRLQALALSSPEVLNGARVIVEGPHGGTELPFPVQRYDCSLIVCGGIGVTPMLPLLQRLVAAYSHGTNPGPSTSNEYPASAPHVTFVWCLRDLVLAYEFSQVLRDMPDLDGRLRIVLNLRIEADEDAISFKQENEALRDCLGPNVVLSVGGQYPDFGNEIDTLEHRHHSVQLKQPYRGSGRGSTPRLAVVVCGPLAMIDDVAHAAGKAQRTRKGPIIHWHSETFHF